MNGADGADGTGSGGGILVKYGSRKARSRISTVSDSQTRRSAWFVPNGGSTPHRCTRTPYAWAASTAGTISSSPATRTASVIARCRARASISARICASTPFCWPRAFRLPSRSFTRAIWAITRWSMVGTRSRAASYQ